MSRVSSPDDRKRGAVVPELEHLLLPLERRAGRLDGGEDGRREIDRLLPQRDLSARDAAHVQQVVHQPGQVVDLALDDAGRALVACPASWAPARRIATALRIGASGLRSSWPSMARNSLIRRSATSSSSMRFRSVRSRVTLAKPRSVPRAVVHRGDHDVGPEPRAVLADAPALVLEPALAAGDAQLVLRASRDRSRPGGRTSRSGGR